jgi:hypothetical protein
VTGAFFVPWSLPAKVGPRRRRGPTDTQPRPEGIEPRCKANLHGVRAFLLSAQDPGSKSSRDFQDGTQLVAHLDGELLVGLTFRHDVAYGVDEGSQRLLVRAFDVGKLSAVLVAREILIRSKIEKETCHVS